jgi:hypothetical protein
VQWFGKSSLCAGALRAGIEQAAEVLCVFYELCPTLLHVSSLVVQYKEFAEDSLQLLCSPLATVQPQEVSTHALVLTLMQYQLPCMPTTTCLQALDRLHTLEQWVYSEVGFRVARLPNAAGDLCWPPCWKGMIDQTWQTGAPL